MTACPRFAWTQQGKERKRNNQYSHTWTEVERTQTARPFRLRVPGGTIVHVEPGAEVFLDDDLVEARIHATRRVMCVELKHGEEVTIEGVLARELRPSSGEADYRGQQQSWVLRPPSRSKMLLSKDPVRRHKKYARFWMLTCATCCLFFALAHTVLYANGFWRLVMNSECCHVEVLDHRAWTTRVRNRDTHHTSIIGRVTELCAGGEGSTPIGMRIEEQVESHYPVGTYVPFQIEIGHPTTFRLGTGVGLRVIEWGFLLTATIALAVLGVVRHRALRAWYEKKLNQRAAGRLS